MTIDATTHRLTAWTTPDKKRFRIHVYEDATTNPEARVLRTWNVDADDEDVVDAAQTEAEAFLIEVTS